MILQKHLPLHCAGPTSPQPFFPDPALMLQPALALPWATTTTGAPEENKSWSAQLYHPGRHRGCLCSCGCGSGRGAGSSSGCGRGSFFCSSSWLCFCSWVHSRSVRASHRGDPNSSHAAAGAACRSSLAASALALEVMKCSVVPAPGGHPERPQCSRQSRQSAGASGGGGYSSYPGSLSSPTKRSRSNKATFALPLVMVAHRAGVVQLLMVAPCMLSAS
jgi:hypothetical protein